MIVQNVKLKQYRGVLINRPMSNRHFYYNFKDPNCYDKSFFFILFFYCIFQHL